VLGGGCFTIDNESGNAPGGYPHCEGSSGQAILCQDQSPANIVGWVCAMGQPYIVEVAVTCCGSGAARRRGAKAPKRSPGQKVKQPRTHNDKEAKKAKV
jgi:hypothetical protein